jgi:uncharacterized membrane protein YfcA
LSLPPPGDIAFVVCGALLAGFVNGLSGTGYALISLGLWLHAMSPQTAAPLVAFCSVVGHLQSLPRIWHGVRWHRLWPFLLAGLIGVPIGTALLAHIQVQPLKLAVGVFLLLYAAWMTLVRRPPVVYGGGRWADATVGFIGGLLGGMASVCGPPPAIWAQLRGWDMHEQRGVNQPFNMSILTTALFTAAIAGYIDRTFLVWAAMAVPSTLLAARLGIALYGRINSLQFRWIVLAMLGLSGLSLIVSAIR